MHNIIFPTTTELLKSSGYLEGLTPEQEKVVSDFTLQVNVDKIKTSSIAEEIIVPIIRHIVNHIMTPNEKHSFGLIFDHLKNPFYSDRGVTEEKLLAEINIKELVDDLTIYCLKFLPLAEEYLPYLDGQAELTVLFSHNQMMKILNQAIENGKSK